MNNKRATSRMVLVAALAGLAAALVVLAVVVIRDPRPPVATEQTKPAPKAPAQDPTPEPMFPTPEQTAKYYGTVVAGERRALALVEAALQKARTGDPGQVAKLEQLRTRYVERIKRHQAKLDL